MDTRKIGLGATLGAAGAAALAYGTAKLLKSEKVLNARKRLMKTGNEIIADVKDMYQNMKGELTTKLGLETHELQPIMAGAAKHGNAFIHTEGNPTFHDTMIHPSTTPHVQAPRGNATNPRPLLFRRYNRNR